MKKLNFFVGRLQPVTQGHINCINEGEGPCIVYRINSSNKTIERKKKGIKIGSKSWTDESVNKVIAYIDNPTGDLSEQEKELLKRPFTNELIDKELEIVKKSNKNIIDVIPVTHVYDALGRFNAFLTEHSDEYEVGYWMCGDDRKAAFEDNVEKMAKYDELETEFKSGKTLPNILIGKLKVNTGKGRTEGVSGTAVRKAILNKDKAAFEKIMPKGAGSLFDEFTKAFDEFKAQLQSIIKEHKMMTLKDYINEALNDKILEEYFTTNKNEIKKQLDKFLYDISWHESIGFESTEECNFIIDNLQSEYGFKSTKSYDNRRKTSTIILKGISSKENVNITLEFYPNGDEYNEEPWCDLRDAK